ncbi:flagellar hook protein FliD [Legionella taurinensis]|uniref:Flagellar hook-associated protein 2 n=1 Tax=Legionella taurinensis TaxID=70611 RepID=A0A3A5L676_9GAMM|nr:flagellar filament capping protein FliD [Legionella taurinensis]MDX1836845.1 flagellar filament capping protein FliD [Legionella taurinensis]PUT41262.1 flagellar hook protein FliD [Legionella taurinensis]PUT42387.1 flagellar hook protein FliD [Legionella taurinensis]PUT43913.1 flagellar hook protein FliD [Legionella taurinensis]PUT47168.1 flagellar hook protein FliD [Legionella taurinensis]
MASISPTGGSSLDIKAIVDALVAADITPAKSRLDKLEASYTTKLSAVGQIKGSLAKLQTAMMKLSDLQQFYAMKSTVSDPNLFSASASTEAVPGVYDVEVRYLASRQSLASSPVASANTVVGNGSITIDFGTYSNDLSTFTANPDKQAVTINIAPGQNTLQAIRDAINANGSGVKAAIVQDSQGARLTLSSPDTGKNLAMKISVNDADGNNTNGAGLSALAYDPTAGITNLQETAAARDSEIKINGLTLTQSTNQYKDALAGVTIDLRKADLGTTYSLTIENNKAQLTGFVNEFIKQFNEAMTTLNNLTGYNKETKQGGLLQGDASTRNLKLSISKIISQPIDTGDSAINSLADIGIKTDAKGLLTLNTADFDAAVNDHYDAIGSLFAKTAVASDSNIRIKSVGADVKAGSYAINISSFTAGVTLAGTIGGLSATSSDGLTLKGSGALKNLSLQVIGGSTGDRGSVVVSDGIAAQLNNLVTDYLGDKGDLANRTKQLNDNLKDLDNQRLRLDTHMTSLRKRYTAQFTRLDVLLSSLQDTSAFLTQQLANLPKINS